MEKKRDECHTASGARDWGVTFDDHQVRKGGRVQYVKARGGDGRCKEWTRGLGIIGNF